MTTNNSTRELLEIIYEAKALLKQKGVIRSERFTGELDEWIAEQAYGGKRAKATSQKGGDIELKIASEHQRLQVRTHAKGKSNKARWTEIKPDSIKHFDRLIIIVLSDDYFIKEWYDIPKKALRKPIITKSGKTWIVKWDEAKAYEKNLASLPNAKQVMIFNEKSKV